MNLKYSNINILPTSISVQILHPENIPQRLDEVLNQALRDQRIVGTVVMVAHNGQIIYERAAGMADRESGNIMEKNAIFRLASMTKPLVSVAAMKLIEQKILALDDPVTKWLPEFKPHLSDHQQPTLTIRHLLTHTAGLSYGFLEEKNGPYQRAYVSDGLDQPGLNFDENLRRIASVPLIYPPGTAWQYSIATDVLGGILSKATGKPLAEIIDQLITKPLSMPDTTFKVTDQSRLVTPYGDGNPKPIRMSNVSVVPIGTSSVHFSPDRALNPESYESGGAGMLGTAGDFIRFLETIRIGNPSILSQNSLSELMSNQLEPSIETHNPGWGFSYGWAVLEDPQAANTPQSKGTIQWGGIYGHSWFVDPVQKITVVALTNTAVEGMSGKFPEQIRDAIYGIKPTDKN